MNHPQPQRRVAWLSPWWGVPLLLLGVGIGCSAGTWQLHRMTEKRQLEASFAAGTGIGAGAGLLHRLVPDDTAAGLRYRILEVQGRYDPAHQVLLDNMSSDQGQPGYEVLTPLRTADGIVLVNRGWVPADGDRRRLPDVAVGDGPRTVRGRLDELPRPGIVLGPSAPPADGHWPRRLLFPTAAEISAQIDPGGHAILRRYQLLLDPGADDGYVRNWHPNGLRAARHLAYAVQWFGLALTAVVIFLVLKLRHTDHRTPM